MDILVIKLEATPPQVPHTLSATPLLWPYTYERVELLCSSTKNQVPGFKNDWVIDILIFEGHTSQVPLPLGATPSRYHTSNVQLLSSLTRENLKSLSMKKIQVPGFENEKVMDI
jgi:hypothetical protein